MFGFEYGELVSTALSYIFFLFFVVMLTSPPPHFIDVFKRRMGLKQQNKVEL